MRSILHHCSRAPVLRKYTTLSKMLSRRQMKWMKNIYRYRRSFAQLVGMSNVHHDNDNDKQLLLWQPWWLQSISQYDSHLARHLSVSGATYDYIVSCWKTWVGLSSAGCTSALVSPWHTCHRQVLSTIDRQPLLVYHAERETLYATQWAWCTVFCSRFVLAATIFIHCCKSRQECELIILCSSTVVCLPRHLWWTRRTSYRQHPSLRPQSPRSAIWLHDLCSAVILRSDPVCSTYSAM